jgi:hypothetical protein
MPVARPAGVQCPKWEPASTGSKRCRYYIDPAPEELQDEGLCRLPDEMVCVEWVRRFGTDAQRAALKLRAYPAGSSARPPSADPDAPPPLTLAVQDPPPPRLTLVRSPAPPMPRGEPLVALGRVSEFTPAPEVDPAGIEALERAGVEVDLASSTLGIAVTLVPARTGRTDRHELTYREGAVIRMIVDCFPGSCLVGFRAAGEPPRRGGAGDPVASPTLLDRFERTPDGHVNNCSLANGEAERDCQICEGACPDRVKFDGVARALDAATEDPLS